MCLRVSDFDVKVAKEDIHLYKLIVESNDRLYTPYRWYEIKVDTEYISDLILEPIKNTIKRKVNIGLHSIKDIKACKNIRLYDFKNASNVKIYACTIPKGSKYYIGTFTGIYGKAESYASDTLIYNEDTCL